MAFKSTNQIDFSPTQWLILNEEWFFDEEKSRISRPVSYEESIFYEVTKQWLTVSQQPLDGNDGHEKEKRSVSKFPQTIKKN